MQKDKSNMVQFGRRQKKRNQFFLERYNFFIFISLLGPLFTFCNNSMNVDNFTRTTASSAALTTTTIANNNYFNAVTPDLNMHTPEIAREEEVTRRVTQIHDSLCGKDSITIQGKNGRNWKSLCAGHFVKILATQLLYKRINNNMNRKNTCGNFKINVVQIGAHVGFEENDPLASGLVRLLDLVEQTDQDLSSKSTNSRNNNDMNTHKNSKLCNNADSDTESNGNN